MRQRLIPVSSETVSPVSPETSTLRLLPSQRVSQKPRATCQTSGETTHLARVYALLDEDGNRRPSDIVRLTGIPKATVCRLVERYHRENAITLRQQDETAS